ncbi:MAG: hypothetical protein AAFX87_24645 [Bacteroidota bacterium]
MERIKQHQFEKFQKLQLPKHQLSSIKGGLQKVVDVRGMGKK